MPLSLEQYAASLDPRNLPWPAPPEVHPAKARPHLKPLPDVRAVVWTVYGTLLAVPGGELFFEHPQKFMMELALDKTLQEFRMWGSMTRKPGQPAEYLKQLFERALSDQRLLPSPGEKHPEVLAEKVWEDIVKKLMYKEYQWDVGFYGSLNEFTRKLAYFFHASLQGTGACPGAVAALRHVAAAGLLQGWLDNGQCFTAVQLERGLAAEDPAARLDDFFAPDLRVLSHEFRARKPSENLFRQLLGRLGEHGIEADQVLHVGTNIERDIAPARRLGLRTALFAGNQEALRATAEQLKDSASRPSVLLTDLAQIADVITGR
jgi:FMN phosphatase YigB (HAD superfamily)